MKQVTLTNGYDFTYDTVHGAVTKGAVHHTGLMAEASFGVTFLKNHPEAAALFRKITADSRPDIKEVVERTIKAFAWSDAPIESTFEASSERDFELLMAAACLAGVVQTTESMPMWMAYQGWCTVINDLTDELGNGGWDNLWEELSVSSGGEMDTGAISFFAQGMAVKRRNELMLDTLAQVYIDHFGIDLEAMGAES